MKTDDAGAGLLPQHLELIQASAITPDVARARGYRSVTAKADLKRAGFADSQCIVPTLLIPVYDVRGEVALYQHRPDNPRIRDGKPLKYETPARARMVLDVPPSSRSRLGDPATPLFITEGLRKGDSLVSHGLCAIDILGVWNWRGRNGVGGTTVLPDWEVIALKGRHAYVVFDSDVMIKAEVHAALERLAAFLKGARGAHVSYIYLPHESGGKKCGVDDFLAAGRSVEDLLACATTTLRRPPRAANKDERTGGQYETTPAGLVLHKTTKDGAIAVPLTNFTARITANIVEDDGAEERRVFEIEASLNGRPAPRVRIPPSEFNRMDWPMECLGANAIVYAGLGAKDHTRVAIQIHSGEKIAERRIYTHTGWRRLDDPQWAYLHAGGAIGEQGAVGNIEVVLDDALREFKLPVPGSADEQRAAVNASLGVLGVAPMRITVPLLGAVARAVLGDPDHAVHVAGATGVHKTELAALAQQHFGAAMDSRHLPTTWASTANSIEGLLFTAKDALVTVDDFAPGGTLVDVQRLHASAARVFRSAGNRAGRNRMRADASLTAPKPPRGLVLSTGEDVPRAQSVLARTFVVEIEEGDVDRGALSRCQADAAAGLYAQALAGFIRWLAPRLDEIRRDLRTAVERARGDSTSGSRMHGRTVDIRAGLLFALRLYVRFALEIGAIDVARAGKIAKDAGGAFDEVAAAQREHQTASDPVTRFIDLLNAALASGRAHVAGVNGDEPAMANRWGWRARGVGFGEDERTEWQPQGDRVGWTEGDDLYLEPGASYKAAQSMARDGGEPITVGQKTLAKRLGERGLLIVSERSRGRWTARENLEGVRRAVLHLACSALSLIEDSAQSAQSGENPNDSGIPAGPILETESAHQIIGQANRPTESPAPGCENARLAGAGPIGPSSQTYKGTASDARSAQGWPATVGGHARTIGPLEQCATCGVGTWARYGDDGLCLACARAREERRT